jgi:hypothetical protein
VAQGKPSIVFSIDLAVIDSSNGKYDQFAFTLYNMTGSYLSQIVFDNSNLKVLYGNAGGSLIDTGKLFTNNMQMNLTVFMNLASNKWSATLNGGALFQNQPLHLAGQTLNLGDIDPEWYITDIANPGDNYLLFDNYAVRAATNLVAPTILTQPTNQTVNAGNIATFSVAANGTAPFHYQWRFNGTNLVGATDDTLTLLNTSASDIGNYSVVVSNFVSTVTSQNAALTVLTPTNSTRLSGLTVSSRGAQLQLLGTAGRTFTLEASTNLLDWIQLSTAVNPNGTLQFSDSATNLARRFYRVRKED